MHKMCLRIHFLCMFRCKCSWFTCTRWTNILGLLVENVVTNLIWISLDRSLLEKQHFCNWTIAAFLLILTAEKCQPNKNPVFGLAWQSIRSILKIRPLPVAYRTECKSTIGIFYEQIQFVVYLWLLFQK